MIAEEHVGGLLPAYALGCLDEDELAAVRQHLSECEACRTDLATYQVVTDQLGLAVPMVEPSPRLKQRVMSGVKVKKQDIQPSPGRRNVGKLLQSFVFSWQMVAVVAILALVGSNLFFWQQGRNPQTVNKPSGFQYVTLTGTAISPGASGMIVISGDGHSGTLIVQDLPPLEAGHQYQLWLVQNGKQTNGGVFSVMQGGYASIWVDSPQPLINYQSFGITIEPAGGSPQPTGAKVLGSKL